MAIADEQPRACAQRVVGEALSHRPPADVRQGRLWLQGAASRECFIELNGTLR